MVAFPSDVWQRLFCFANSVTSSAMAEILHINAINRRIDEELAKAKAKYGSRHFDIIVLESSRGDTISDRNLLGALSQLNQTGSRYKATLRQVAPDD
jgi:hypothetical protein